MAPQQKAAEKMIKLLLVLLLCLSLEIFTPVHTLRFDAENAKRYLQCSSSKMAIWERYGGK